MKHCANNKDEDINHIMILKYSSEITCGTETSILSTFSKTKNISNYLVDICDFF